MCNCAHNDVFFWARELVFTRLETVSKPPREFVKSCLQVDLEKKTVLPLITNMAESLKGKQVTNFVVYY